jgi:hypothetical protein
MTQEHPITPPPELVQQWYDNMGPDPGPFESFANAAARWGSDQELEACLRLVEIEVCDGAYELSRYIRAARRPKPPSLKEQALALLDKAEDPRWDINDFSIVRKALEQLDD